MSTRPRGGCGSRPGGRDDELAHVQTGLGADLDTMLVYNLLRTHSYLGPFLDADLRQQQLTSAQLNALLVLASAGPDGLLMGEVGERLVVTKSNVTGLIDRLEAQGLVSRCEHQDRRATVVRLTGEGAALIDRVRPGHAELVARLTGSLTEHDKRTLVRLLTKLRAELRRQRQEGPS